MIAGRRRDRLRFGCFPTVLGTLMPLAFARFRRSHPDVRLTVVDDHLHRLVPRMDDGELDLAVIYDHEALPDVGARALVGLHCSTIAIRPFCPRSTRWHGARPSCICATCGRAVDRRGAEQCLVPDRAHACRTAGFAPEAGFASDDYIAVQALVAAGLGVSVVPGLAVVHPLPGVVVRQLASGAPTRRISAVCPLDGYRSPAIDAMIDSLRITAGTTEF